MYIVVGTYDGSLVGWDTSESDRLASSGAGASLRLAYAFPAHAGSLRALALGGGGGGGTLVSGGVDETVRVYDVRRRREVGSLAEHSGAVTAVAWVGRGHLLSGDSSGGVAVWRAADWLCLDMMRGHK